MRIIQALAVPAALAFAVPAAAQTAPAAPAATPSQYARALGELVSLSATSVTVRAADGKTSSFAIGPTSQFFVSKVIPASAIKPGDFIATTNINIDDHSGRATELRVYPASAASGGRGSRASSYPMGQPNTTMTNAGVSEVTDNAEGRVIKVKYPGGERQILLPATVKVIGQFVLDRAAFMPGWHVTVIARADAQGVLTVVNLQTGENGAPVPGR